MSAEEKLDKELRDTLSGYKRQLKGLSKNDLIRMCIGFAIQNQTLNLEIEKLNAPAATQGEASEVV